jgi:hypothetical protein
MIDSIKNLNQRIKEVGVIWTDCHICGINWPFPKGHDSGILREFKCPVCCYKEVSEMRRLFEKDNNRM